MKPLLPLVLPEIGFSLAESLNLNLPDNKYVRTELKYLDDKNPVIANFIRDWSLRAKDKVRSAMCGILVYRLLESQAEANRMREEFKI